MNNKYRLRAVMLMAAILMAGSTAMADGSSTTGVKVHGNVFGGGNEADVKVNTEVNISTGKVYGSVYGGGNVGSVGTFTTTDETYTDTNGDTYTGKKPTACTSGGTTSVLIDGNAQIGPDGNMSMSASGGPDDFGHVFGAGKGLVADTTVAANNYVRYAAYTNTSGVTIQGEAFVKGAVYGGSENGHVLGNTSVTITSGQIGCGDEKTEPYSEEDWEKESLAPCNSWEYNSNGNGAPYDMFAMTTSGNEEEYPDGSNTNGGRRKGSDGHTFYGNVFGGGSGYYPYAPGKWLRSAGRVEGSTTVTITGGHILSNVYGGCEMADVMGSSTVTMSGGTVGVPRRKNEILANPTICHLYGAGKGDKRIFFNTSTNVASTAVTITGGTVYGSVYGGGEDGHVMGNAVTTIKNTTTTTGTGDDAVTSTTSPIIGCNGESGYDGNVFGGGQGSPTALTAGVVGGNVTLNIQGGEMSGSVYGGGRIASVGTYFAMANAENYGKMQEGDDHGIINVTLTGGSIAQNVYGGCMGTNADAAIGVTEDFAAKLGLSKNVTVSLNGNVADTEKGCVVEGNIFGCNNVNSSPEGSVTVHVYATQNKDAKQIAGTVTGEGAIAPKKEGRYDVKAVYGGGNLAAYIPINATSATATDEEKAAAHTTVIIDGCDRTSIKQVYGGGNAASTPATEVTVNGTYEIDELFGGGNGADKLPDGSANPGANVGFYAYDDNVEDKSDTPEHRAANYGYGSGVATVNIKGGTIHSVFGGSNTKGNVRHTALTMLEEVKDDTGEPCCPFNVDEAYGGGKSAPMDAEAKLLMACIPGLKEAYGGAEAADIQGDVTLTITNGTFQRVFGGNNISGTIRGAITVNIEEVGCKPIIIGELYGGGNLASYSIYGYKKETDEDGNTIWFPRRSLTDGGTAELTAANKDPEVNIKLFTSIGDVYGGGYGQSAVMVGSPMVNINVAADGTTDAQTYTITRKKDGSDDTDTIVVANYEEETITIDEGKASEHTVIRPSHLAGQMGAIYNVYGGGNAAEVDGNTYVNIGTSSEVYVKLNLDKDDTLPDDCYIRTGEGTEASPYDYTEATGTAAADTTYYKKYTVLGADIRGNVFGGGNNAKVTGNTNVTIGKKEE